jgi:hypothetical protein
LTSLWVALTKPGLLFRLDYANVIRSELKPRTMPVRLERIERRFEDAQMSRTLFRMPHFLRRLGLTTIAGFCIFPMHGESIEVHSDIAKTTFSDGKRQGRLFLDKVHSPDYLSVTDAAVLWSGSLTSIRF